MKHPLFRNGIALLLAAVAGSIYACDAHSAPPERAVYQLRVVYRQHQCTGFG